MSKSVKLESIKAELRPLLEGFLSFEPYKDLFKQFAKVAGYHGDDEDKILKSLFVPMDDGQIYFSVDGLYDLFLEYQLILQLSDKEPYKTLLDRYPEAIRNIRELAKKIFNKEKIGEQDLIQIFNEDQYKQNKKE